MDKEIRKRTEEAAEEYRFNNIECLMVDSEIDSYTCRDAFLTGAEYGYREAVEMGKKWLRNHLGKDNGTPYFIKAFETDMNKLWEGEK